MWVIKGFKATWRIECTAIHFLNDLWQCMHSLHSICPCNGPSESHWMNHHQQRLAYRYRCLSLKSRLKLASAAWQRHVYFTSYLWKSYFQGRLWLDKNATIHEPRDFLIVFGGRATETYQVRVRTLLYQLMRYWWVIMQSLLSRL